MLSGYSSNADTQKYFTCQICNSLFTCLDYYQKHRKEHAKSEGIILYTCDRCPFASEKSFNFNWHVMGHESAPHRCDVCASDHQSTTDKSYRNQNSNNSAVLSTRKIINLIDNSFDDQSISQTIILNGKRSIATETNNDLILSSDITDSPTNDLCHLQMINAQNLSDDEIDDDNGQNVETDNENVDPDEDDNATIIQDDLNDNYDVDTEPEDEKNVLELYSNEMNNGILQQNNCDIMRNKYNQEHYLMNENENNLNNIIDGYNENNIGLQDESQIQFKTEPNEFNQMIPNGFNNNNINSNDMIDNLQSSNNFNNSLSYTLSAGNNGVKNNCDKTVQPLTKTDIYEFNSDEDLDQPNKEKLLKSKFISQIPAQQSTSSSILQFSNPPPLANFHIQSFINPSTGLPIESTSNRTNVNQSHIPFVAQINTNFIFPNPTTNTGTFAPQNTQNTTFFNTANTYANPNGTIRILPIQNLQNPPTTSQLTNATFINIPNNGINNNNIDDSKPINELRKHSKKKNKLDQVNILPNSIEQPFNAPVYQSCKGKGKGNRKPRISFVSIINGITVGADGIRRKFHCSLCGNGKSFKTKSHLQRHMLTHTGEKPYQCNECGAKFNQSSSLRNHIIAIHTKKFPHICATCNKGFLMPAVLQKHLQVTGHKSLH